VPFDHPGKCIVDADTILELERLPQSLIIVGGGVIGCEYASIFAEINVKVTLIHTGEHILPFLDGELRDSLASAMRERSVEFCSNASVTKVTVYDDGRVVVSLEDGGVASGDALLWAAGRSSNTHNMGLESVGVQMGQRGLVTVNEHFQTSMPSIYAAGDVIGFPALAATSMEQGRIAACHMFDIDFKTGLSQHMPVGLYTIPAVSYVGMMEADATESGRDVVIGRASYRANARGRMLGDERGVVKCIFDRKTKALLGAGIVGEDATELVHIAQTVIAAGLGIDHFIGTCFNYPSLGELYKYAAYSALQAKAAEAQPLAA
jgi:NAD(P) transhydrogenase